MVINPVQIFLARAEEAFRDKKYLNKNFKLVSLLDQRGSAEELVGFLREEGVIHSKDSHQITDLSKLFTYLGLLYKDSLKNMHICNWMRDSTKLIQNDREYTERLQEVTSIFYMVCQYHSRWSGRFTSVERGISLALEMRQYETITVDVPETFTDSFKWHLPNVNTRKGMAFLVAFASAHKKNAQSKSQESPTWIPFLKKYSLSKDSEIKRLASYLLAHCEYHEKIYQRSIWSINPTLKFKVNGEWAKTTERYFTCLEAATRIVLDFYEKHGKHDCFFKYNEDSLTGVVTVLEKMGELGREIADLTSVYGFFRHELNLTCKRLHKARVDVRTYKNVYGEETFLPSVQEYSKIRPERLLAEPELPQEVPKKPTQKPKKAAHKRSVPITSSSYQSSEESTVSSMPKAEVEVLENEVEITTKKPDWRTQIRLGYSSPVALNYTYHVTRWFTDIESALSEEPYCTQAPEHQKHSIFVHAFPLFIDQFVGSDYCYQGTYYNPRTKNTDTLYSIPVEVNLFDGSAIRGVCQYAVDSTTGVCYHRCIRRQHPDTFVQSFFNKKVWNEVDFPPLERATQSTKKHRLKLKAEKMSFLYDREFGSVTFKEKGNQITLYRMD